MRNGSMIVLKAGDTAGAYGRRCRVPPRRSGSSRAMGAKAIWREDLITALLAVLLVAGLFLDGWNHINLQNGALGSFWTIWHALLYLGFNLTAIWVITRNPHLYSRAAKPAPYFHPILGIP